MILVFLFSFPYLCILEPLREKNSVGHSTHASVVFCVHSVDDFFLFTLLDQTQGSGISARCDFFECQRQHRFRMGVWSLSQSTGRKPIASRTVLPRETKGGDVQNNPEIEPVG